MPIASNFDLVPIWGEFVVLDGTPLTGQVFFEPTFEWISIQAPGATRPQVILPALLEGRLINGVLKAKNTTSTLEVFANDDPDITSAGPWRYKVTERFVGVSNRKPYYIDVPIASKSVGVDLVTVAPAAAPTNPGQTGNFQQQIESAVADLQSQIDRGFVSDLAVTEQKLATRAVSRRTLGFDLVDTNGKFLPEVLPAVISGSAFVSDINTTPRYVTPAATTARTLLVQALNQANKYTLNTWLPSGTADIVPTSNTEQAVRPYAMAAVGLSASIAANVHDTTITGRSVSQTVAQIKRLVNGLCGSHISQTPGGWGSSEVPPNSNGTPGWQSASWAARIAYAGFLISNQLSISERQRVAAVTKYEADRVMAWTIPYYRNRAGVVQFAGDSKSEEIAWNAEAVLLAIVMMPKHPDAARWMAKLSQLGVAAHARPADLLLDTTINGFIPSDVLGGTNIQDDFSVINHDQVHPDYQVAGNSVLFSPLAAFSAAGMQPPAAALWNGGEIYRSLIEKQWTAGATVPGTTAGPVLAPGGSIYVPGSSALYYPQGNDWGTRRVAHFANMDILALRYDWHPDAALWAQRHLQRVVDDQARSTTGQQYTSAGEDTYGGREQWVAHNLGTALAALYAAPATPSRAVTSFLVDLNVAGAQPAVSAPAPAPAQPVSLGKVGGLSSSNVTATSATISWSAVSGSTGYEVQVRKTGDTTWFTKATPSGTTTSIDFGSADTAYQIQVRATTSSSQGAYSDALAVRSAAANTTPTPTPTPPTGGSFEDTMVRANVTPMGNGWTSIFGDDFSAIVSNKAALSAAATATTGLNGTHWMLAPTAPTSAAQFVEFDVSAASSFKTPAQFGLRMRVDATGKPTGYFARYNSDSGGSKYQIYSYVGGVATALVSVNAPSPGTAYRGRFQINSANQLSFLVDGVEQASVTSTAVSDGGKPAFAISIGSDADKTTRISNFKSGNL